MDETQKPDARKPRPPAGQNSSKDAPSRRSATLRVGDPLEYRVARLFVWSDFFVRRGREIYTVAALDRATDLDVLAIRYTQPFRKSVQIAECKSDGDRPLDRIFWLSGVQKFIGADNATLFRRSTKWNIKDFAKVVGVEILDHPRLEELEKDVAVDTSVWPGVSDRAFFLAHEDEWNKSLQRDEPLTELYLTLASEVRYQDPFGGINYLLHHARALTRALKEKRLPSESFGRFLLCETLAHLAMFLMQVAESSFSLSSFDRSGLIKRGLTYGHMDPKLIDRIFRNAHRIASETLKHYARSDVKVDESFFRMPAPPNVSEVQDIIELLIRHPRASTSFVPLTDLLLSEMYLKGRSTDWIGRLYTYSDMDDRLALVRKFIQIVKNVAGGPDELEPIALPAGKKARVVVPESTSTESHPAAAPPVNTSEGETKSPSLFDGSAEVSQEKTHTDDTEGN
ncbi:MAG TPA: hypothetical protein VMH20_04990 [Verrucomicrobiae bacterium]|nr:hypothetical protein [Verrucomicrobiae bacterium]